MADLTDPPFLFWSDHLRKVSACASVVMPQPFFCRCEFLPASTVLIHWVSAIQLHIARKARRAPAVQSQDWSLPATLQFQNR